MLNPRFGGPFGRGPPVRVEINLAEVELSVQSYEFDVCDLHTVLQRWEDDNIKRNVVEYVWTHHAFNLLRRHFQLELWLPTRQTYDRVSYDSNMGYLQCPPSRS